MPLDRGKNTVATNRLLVKLLVKTLRYPGPATLLMTGQTKSSQGARASTSYFVQQAHKILQEGPFRARRQVSGLQVFFLIVAHSRNHMRHAYRIHTNDLAWLGSVAPIW